MKKGKIAGMTATMVITALCLSQVQMTTAYAVEGWNHDTGVWRYLDRNDQPMANVWKQSKGAWFYLDEAGNMVTDRFINLDNGTYYVDKEGKRAQGQWVHIQAAQDGREAGWYYFGDNGRAYGRTDSFMRTIDGKHYIFDEQGKMLTGWLDENGYSLADRGAPLTDGVYYAGPDGALWTNAWLDLSTQQVADTSSLASQVTGKDYNEYSNLWIYFDQHSKRVKSNGDRPRQMVIGGKIYGFDDNGIMLPWWSKVASVSDADKSNPTASESPKFYAGYDGGPLLENTWFWMCPSKNLSPNDYNEAEYSWWRADGKGDVIRNRIRQVNGRTYAFDGLGRMRTGFVLFDGKDIFVAQYDPDAWTAQAFKDGDIYGITKADLYMFSPDELNDGSMQTGSNLKVELEDGVHTFGFGKNGIAYGNRNRLRRVDNAYYINGLRLDADEDYGYGVVLDNGNNNYWVVGTQGRIVTGDRKVVKDGDDGWLVIVGNRFKARVMDGYKPRWINGPQGPGYYHYDADNKENMYAGGLIAGYDTPADPGSLPQVERLNFN